MLPLLCQPQHAPPFALTLVDWLALSPGLDSPESWKTWATNTGNSTNTPPASATHEPNVAQAAKPAPLAAQPPATPPNSPVPTPLIPMMLARRMGKSSRFAVQSALALMQRHPVAALVFSSRHAELERTFQILNSIENNTDISPTDFAMSVHNAAVGQLTITAQKKLPSSSVAAGTSTFQQALHEVRSLLASGASTVLHVDFDSPAPEFYQPLLNETTPPYAAAFLWTNTSPGAATPSGNPLFTTHYSPFAESPTLPLSLQFLKSILQGKPTFTVSSPDAHWQWHSSKN